MNVTDVTPMPPCSLTIHVSAMTPFTQFHHLPALPASAQYAQAATQVAESVPTHRLLTAKVV